MNRPIVHFEFAAPYATPLHEFYNGLFGWPIKEMGPGYALIETPDGSPNGAVLEAPKPAVTLGESVTDLAAAVASAESLGGTIVMEPIDNGWVNKAQVSDPAGNVITLIQEGGAHD